MHLATSTLTALPFTLTKLMHILQLHIGGSGSRFQCVRPLSRKNSELYSDFLLFFLHPSPLSSLHACSHAFLFSISEQEAKSSIFILHGNLLRSNSPHSLSGMEETGDSAPLGSDSEIAQSEDSATGAGCKCGCVCGFPRYG